jgi:hypothetical protein
MAELTAMERFLAANKDKWTETAEKLRDNPTAFDNLPDGVYIALLSSAQLTESKAGNLMIIFAYTILEGDYEGETVREFQMLSFEDSVKRLARRMVDLGYDPTALDITNEGVLEAWLEEVAESEFNCKIRLKMARDGQRQNVYLEKLLDEGDSAPAAPARAAAPPVEPPKRAPKPEAAPPAPSAEKPPKPPKPAPAPPAAPEPEPPADGDVDEGDVDLTVGMKVSFEQDGATKTGVVKSIDEEGGTAAVKVGLRSYTVSFDDMTVVDSELDG